MQEEIEKQPSLSERPIAPLIFLCYFFPLVALLIVTTACEVATGFALSTALSACCALALYVILKRWEHTIKKNASSTQVIIKKEEPIITSQSFDNFLQEKELWQKERERYETTGLDREAIIKELLKERDLLLMEKKLLIDQKESDLERQSESMQSQEDEIRRMNDTLQDRDDDIRDKERLIEKLKFEIENLNFELKTLLKLERRSPSAGLF